MQREALFLGKNERLRDGEMSPINETCVLSKKSGGSFSKASLQSGKMSERRSVAKPIGMFFNNEYCINSISGDSFVLAILMGDSSIMLSKIKDVSCRLQQITIVY
jgi:hypothetical protein